jgi:hypothetical protein
MTDNRMDGSEQYSNGSSIREAANRAWADSLHIHPKPSWRDNAFSAAALQRLQFPPVKWVVPNFVPEGLTLLCGRPKIGKSFAGLDIGLAVATGGEAFGRRTEKGEVLYAALDCNEGSISSFRPRRLGPQV